MAWMNQVKKAKIADALKAVMPKDWKYSLKVENHTAILMTIRSAPFDILASMKGGKPNRDHVQVNEFHLDAHWEEPVLSVLKAAAAALNTDNFDKSDPMTDYFHVGHYVNLHIGAWDKPFVVIEGKPEKKVKAVKPTEFPTFTAADTVVIDLSKAAPAEVTFADQMSHFISGLAA